MTPGHAITLAEVKRAIEGHDAKTLSAYYADDALVRIIDQDNPPSKPRELKGKQAIAAYFDDVCGRAISHQVESGVSNGDAIAFTEACTYPDGAKVFCAAMLEIEDGKIVRQTAVKLGMTADRASVNEMAAHQPNRRRATCFLCHPRRKARLLSVMKFR